MLLTQYLGNPWRCFWILYHQPRPSQPFYPRLIGVVQYGTHKVSVVYANPHKDIPVRACIDVGDATINTTLTTHFSSGLKSTLNRNRVERAKTVVLNQTTQVVGQLLLRAGRARLYFRIHSTPGAEYKLNRLILERIK